MGRTALLGVFAALLLAAYLAPGSAKVWDRCELARTLLHVYKFPRDQIDSWMCIAFRESRYNSAHINTINTDGSKDYGLFQINNRWWCHNKESPLPDQNMCNVSCNRVLKHMSETIRCIKIMYAKSRNTWQPWITYPYCQKEDMTQYTKGCNLTEVLEKESVFLCADVVIDNLENPENHVVYLQNMNVSPPLDTTCGGLSMTAMNTGLQKLGNKTILGINKPSVYIGTEFSTFPCHREDMAFLAMNRHIVYLQISQIYSKWNSLAPG